MLDNNSKALLKRLYKYGSMSASDVNTFTGYKENERNQITSELQRLGYIEYLSNGDDCDGIFHITPPGRAYLEQRKHDILMFWLPYSITTVIAISSLIVSIVALGAHC